MAEEAPEVKDSPSPDGEPATEDSPSAKSEAEVKDISSPGYEPKVIAFCCHYCTYSAADLAGSMRLEYSPNIRVVKLMCTGKVEPGILMKAFEDGADAVMVGG